jgi:hypothetical protein
MTGANFNATNSLSPTRLIEGKRSGVHRGLAEISDKEGVLAATFLYTLASFIEATFLRTFRRTLNTRSDRFGKAR